MELRLIPFVGIPDAEDIVNAFFGALQKIFGNSAQEALRGALNDVADNIPSLDLSDPVFDRYDGMFAIALLCATIATALQLFRMLRLHDWETVIDFLKILPITYLIGASLPYVSSVAAGAIGNLHKDSAEWIMDRPLNGKSFDFEFDGDFGLVELVVGWAGGWLLEQESQIFIDLLPRTLLVLILLFGLRWFGVMGDGMFVITFGITVITLVSPTVMLLTLGVFFMNAKQNYGATYVVTAVAITAVIPIFLLWLYFKLKLPQRVAGIMESRALNTQISKRTAGSASGGGVAGKAALAGAGMAAGSLVAAHYGDGRDVGTTRRDYVRDKMYGQMASKAAMAARTNPVAAVGLLMGAKLLKPKPPTGRQPEHDSTYLRNPSRDKGE